MNALRWTLAGGLLFGAVAAFPWGGEGTDDRAVAAVEALRPGYSAWRAPLFEPSESAERVLFIAQAAMGGAILGWAIGRRRAA